MKNQIIHADVVDGLKTIPDNTVNTCVTSPPYYRLAEERVNDVSNKENLIH